MSIAAVAVQKRTVTVFATVVIAMPTYTHASSETSPWTIDVIAPSIPALLRKTSMLPYLSMAV